MSYEIGTATSHTDLLDKLNTFLGKGHALAPTYTGTGNGTITGLIGTATSVQETITVTLTSATAFSVSGSVTGSMGTGTVGTLFTHAKVTFTMNAGGTAWVNGDTIVFVMTVPWSAQRSSAGSEYIWKAPGNANTDSIYVGARVFSDAGADYYNWQLGGFTGYNSALDFGLQPGSIVNSSTLRGPVLTLWNGSTPYWFIADGRRCIIVAHVSSVYVMGYLGFINSYMSPGQYPYPLMVGGNMAWSSEPGSTSVNWRWSYTATASNGEFWRSSNTVANDLQQCRIRRWDGTWRGFSGHDQSTYVTTYGQIWPFCDSRFTDVRPNLDGTYPIFPFVPSEDQGNGVTNIFGEFSGVFAVTGHANSVENTITIGRDTYLVVQNVYHTTKTDYCAVKLA